jgi:secernin
MCDTLIARGAATLNGLTLFGKNSDRQRNEAQLLESVAAADHPVDSQVTCTYLTIPQVHRTHAVLLSRPFWCWGAEMGANEHGVVIGNEGIHARIPAPETAALTGMDLVRLALERAATAAEALRVMTTLLEHYGQGGNCGHLTPNYYNNGFIIADPTEAFVLETVGREWLVERVQELRAISNAYTIGRSPERVSAGLPQLIRASGWSESASPDYAAVMGNLHREHIGQAGARRARSETLLRSNHGKLDAAKLRSILRDHGGPPDQDRPGWSPEHSTQSTLCMHAGTHDRPGQTMGSWVAEMNGQDVLHWVTGTAAPCLSIFKPWLPGMALPGNRPAPTDRFDPDTLWWRHERLHRAAVLGTFPQVLDSIRSERDALEASFDARVRAVLQGGGETDRSRVVAECWRDASDLEDRWLSRLTGRSAADDTPFRTTWREMNRLAGVEAWLDER